MRLLIGTLLVMLVAAIVGLGLTWTTAERGTAFGAVTIGAWTARPKIGTSDIDPYARASVVRSGDLPVGSGDGITFTAEADDKGRALDGRCDVEISGITPAARYWTLTIYDRQGRVIGNALNRFGFTSQEILRGSNGEFAIRLAPRARAGNWLPTGAIERYTIALRLYDTPVGVATRSQREAPMPAIATVGCP